MPRPKIPPRGVFVPSIMLFDQHLPEDKRIPPVVQHTAMQIKALAWGKTETPPISFSEFSELTGKSVPTLYAHMGLLADKGALRWRSCGNATIIVELLGSLWEVSDSENSEMPVKDHSSVKHNSRSRKSCNSENSEFPENQNRGAGTNAIKDAYCSLLGYIPTDWAAGESVAAKAIGERYTVDEFKRVYLYMKAQPFWKDKCLKLRNINRDIQAVLNYQRDGNGSHQNRPVEREPDAQAAAEINRRLSARKV